MLEPVGIFQEILVCFTSRRLQVKTLRSNGRSFGKSRFNLRGGGHIATILTGIPLQFDQGNQFHGLPFLHIMLRKTEDDTWHDGNLINHMNSLPHILHITSVNICRSVELRKILKPLGHIISLVLWPSLIEKFSLPLSRLPQDFDLFETLTALSWRGNPRSQRNTVCPCKVMKTSL